MEPKINRSTALARLFYNSDSTGLNFHGCGVHFKIGAAKRAYYSIVLSLITPALRMSNDGKTPVLSDFEDAIEEAIKDAATKAYRTMVRPPSKMTIKDAAWQVMEKAYLKASDNGTLPANARQIMYAARPAILAMCEQEKFTSHYFTQTLLHTYLDEHPEETANWDVVHDGRGNLTEPHTKRRVPLSTIEVREYVGEKTSLRPATGMDPSVLYPTSGPVNRYKNVLFVEKEGFDELFQAARLAERYDLAIMSTKGVSVTAARLLIDRIAPNLEKVFVLHDFDVSGFTICGTLGTDSRRYTFENNVEIVDLGLRLADAEAMGLEAETVSIDAKDDTIEKRRNTLERHGATDEEIDFLLPEDKNYRRIELNAMSSRQFIDFIEEKLEEHGVEKLVPPSETLEAHARRLHEKALARKILERAAAEIAAQMAEIKLPDDLEDQIREKLDDNPGLSWDKALAQFIR